MLLKTEIGEFEADRESELMRLYRKAQRQEKAKLAKAEADRKTASDRAMIAGYRVFSRHTSLQEHRLSQSRYAEFCKTDTPCGPKTIQNDDGRKTITVECIDGRASYNLYSDRVCLGSIIDAGGFTLAVVHRDNEGRDHVYAVGVSGNVIQSVECEGVDYKLFCKSDPA
jgi:hypothetical protein